MQYITILLMYSLISNTLANWYLKEGVHQLYKFVLKCKVRYTDTALICDFRQIVFPESLDCVPGELRLCSRRT